jgi:O6-methylguanine-DNA--protein-cysteine methyltransferase
MRAVRTRAGGCKNLAAVISAAALARVTVPVACSFANLPGREQAMVRQESPVRHEAANESLGMHPSAGGTRIVPTRRPAGGREKGRVGREVTAFERHVYALCQSVPAGSVTTYGELARALNSSARAIGQVRMCA